MVARPEAQQDSTRARWCFLAVAVFLIFKIFFFTVKLSDGYVYLLMAKALTEGVTPYRDFFFAHPLGHLIFLAPFARTVSAHPEYLSLLGSIAESVNFFLLYFLLRAQRFSDVCALWGAGFYLFSFT